jgi:hypothetical protein
MEHHIADLQGQLQHELQHAKQEKLLKLEMHILKKGQIWQNGTQLLCP